MGKVKNVGYVIVIYDIGEGRSQKVFKVCKKYLEHYQLSVFRGEITNANLKKLISEIEKKIDRSYDKVTVFKMRSEKVFEEVYVGVDEELDMFL